MPSIKVIQRGYIKKDNSQQIVVRVSHKGKTKYVPTGFNIQPKFFKNEKVKHGTIKWVEINTRINTIVEDVWKNIYNLNGISTDYDISDIVSILLNKPITDFIEFAEKYNERSLINNSPNSYRRNNVTINKFKSFVKKNVKFEDVNEQLLSEFVKHLTQKRGNSPYTINGNLKFLKTVWLEGYRKGLHDVHRSPFDAVRLKCKGTEKERLDENEINCIKNIELPDGWLTLSRDMFLASFYSGGIRFADLCLLEKKDVTRTHLSYVMNKTGKKMSVTRFHQLDELIKKYANSRNELLYPIIQDKFLKMEKKDQFKIIASKNTIVNKNLKKLAKLCGINKNITFHTARHSFADISRTSDISVYDISKMLGHSSINITQNYLNSIDQERMDEAFRRVYNNNS